MQQVKKHVVSLTGLRNEIEHVIGQDAFEKLVERFGGTRLYVPRNLPPEHHLCQLLGSDATSRLASYFGGLNIEIPRGHMAKIERRNDSILADRAGGMTVNKLAFKYRLSERSIRLITNRR